MMPSKKELETVLKAKDEASDTVKKVGQEFENTGKKAEGFFAKLAKEAKQNQKDKRASGESALQKALGSGGGMMDFALDKAGIGPQAMVVDAIGGAFNNVSQKILEVQAGLRDGTDDWKSSINKMAQGVPILGNFVQGFNNIREAITHEKADLEAQNKEIDVMNANTDRMVERSKILKSVLNNLANEKYAINLEMKMIGKEGWEAGMQALENEADAGLHNMKEAHKKQVEEIDANSKAWMDQKRKELETQKNKVDFSNDKWRETAEGSLYDTMNRGVQQESIKTAQNKAKVVAENESNEAEYVRTKEEKKQEYRRKTFENSMRMLGQLNDAVTSSHEMNFAESMRQMRDERAMGFRASGNTLAADRTQAMANLTYQSAVIDQQTKDKIAKIRADAEKAVVGYTPDQRENYNKTIQNQINEEYASAELKKKNLTTQETFNATAAIKNTLDEANLKILRDMAAAGDARAQAEVEEIERLNEQLSVRKNLEDLANPKNGASANEQAAAKKRLADMDLANAKRVARQVQDLQLASYEETANNGASANERLEAKKNAVRIQMEREFAEKKAATEKILGDKNATDAQKKAATAEFEAYKKSSARRFDKALGAEAIANKALSDSTDSLFGAGAEALKAQQKADYQKDIVANTAAANEFLKSIDGKLDKLEPTNATATVGVPIG